MHLSSNESRGSLFMETAVLIPLLMLPSLLSIISSGGGSGKGANGLSSSSSNYNNLGDADSGGDIGGRSGASYYGESLKEKDADRIGVRLLSPDYEFLTENSERVSRKLEYFARQNRINLHHDYHNHHDDSQQQQQSGGANQMTKSSETSGSSSNNIADSLNESIDANVTHKTISSHLTWQELCGASKEIHDFEPTLEWQLKRAQPEIHLLADLLYSMDPENDILHTINDDDERRKVIERVEILYVALRNTYLGRHINYSFTKTERTDEAIKALLSLKNHKDLSAQLMADALTEYLEFLQKFNQISEELIANNSGSKRKQFYEEPDDEIWFQYEQLGFLLSYLNHVEVRLLVKLVFPQLHLLKSQEQMRKLKLRYKREMFKVGLIVEGGILTDIRSLKNLMLGLNYEY